MEHPYQSEPELTGLSLAYKNPAATLIADNVMPRVSVKKEDFRYKKYPVNTFIRTANTKVGRKGRAETMDMTCEKILASVDYHALKAEIPLSDVIAASDGDSPREDKTELVTEGLMLARELRVANLMQDKNNYENTVALTSGEQFDDKDSSALQTLLEAKRSMLIKPNCAIMNSTVLTYLQTHPDFLANYNNAGVATTRGMASVEFIKNLLGLKELYIGEAVLDFAHEGQTPDIKNVWGNNIVLFYKNPTATPKKGLTFGYTAEYEGRKIQSYTDPDPGTDGIQTIKATEKLIELIVAPSCGYLIQNVLSEDAA